jgi:hypothetical protein
MSVKHLYTYIRVLDTSLYFISLHDTFLHQSGCMTHLYPCIRVHDTSVHMYQSA